MISAPIWKDTIYTNSADALNYYIKANGEVIFYGRAIKAPDADNIEINVSKICRDSLKMVMPDFRTITGGTISHTEATGIFEIFNSDDDATALESYLFIFDFLGNSVTDKILSEPINKHIDSRMKVFYTQYADAETTIEVENE